MKAFLAIALMTGLLTQSLSKILVYANYKINQDYIAANLCINKNNVKMCCRGKCHLNKELNKTESSKSTPSQRTSTEETVTFFNAIKPIHILPVGLTTLLTFYNPFSYAFTALHSFYHPPRI